MNQPDTLSLAGTAGAGAKRWRPTVPISPRRSRSLASRSLLRSGRTSARSQRHHRRTGGTHATIQLPPLEPLRIRSARKVVPVVTTPKGGDRPAAYGPRVGGPDPADTPTNGGYRRAAPPGICFSMMASGQRSTDPNGAGDQTATGLRSPQTAPPRRFTASAGISAAGVGGRPRFLTRGPTSGYLWRRGTARRPAWQGSLPPTSLGGREFGQTFACPKSILGDRFCMGWSVHSVDFPYKVGHPLSPTWPQIWEVRHSAKGAWPTGDPTDPRFSPAPRRAVTPVSPGATANWPTGRSVEHRKRRPTVSPPPRQTVDCPRAQRRTSPRGSANPSTFAPNWYPAGWPSALQYRRPPGWARCRANVPVSGVDPGGHRPAIQSGPVPRPAVPMSDGPTGLLIAEPRRRGPPCRAVIAQDRRQLVGRSRGRARVPSPLTVLAQVRPSTGRS
ncbi:hypothetical protein OAory_01114540 [Aspergillus oryzae]|uniref:Uncharacterized protein n=1 Tax=Aspergillus oryzae TaxID=5062 RepID=A0A1S9D4V5_ASPOZ|nr:hypothetical protein OAory_01114540 [Aspergillus oryzae]